MNKRTKRKLYTQLNRIVGCPRELSTKQYERLFILLGGWLSQGKGGLRNSYYARSALQRDKYVPKDPVSLFAKHARLAFATFQTARWHWKIYAEVRSPIGTEGNKNLGVPRGGHRPAVMWDHIGKQSGKALSITIPVNYHLTVAKHGLQSDGRKIIQRVWNHREYSEKETWECFYWDFSGLTKEESSWSKARYCQGFVVKVAGNLFVDTSLSKAVALATLRTVRAGIKSVLGDLDADGR